ncbi:sensor histidine kinase [Clostridium tarantellae]|uniref:histidine kinase n=1 Tax=Clostridium tarantellae TaxID=39493 RepID=A0A6I1MJT9_9CLOT|nr:HAMP domain-containing sensor histidine kinase [Clostridium tarantellae]MPQ42973.1 HAMP domain-containing protein [Clostridium tarantellae]
MKRSISKRIFIITFGIMLFLVNFIMCFQIFFFQKFYLDTKSKNLKNSVMKFRTLYSFDITNSKTLYKALSSFEMDHNAKIAIYSTAGKVQYLADPNSADSEIIIRLNQIFRELYYDSDFTNSLLNSNQAQIKLYNSSEFDSKYIVCMVPFSLSSEKDSVLIAITSFKPIEDAVYVIKEFYKYILIVVIILGLILSYIYSNLISKPLIKITKTAKKMSAMDFSEKCAMHEVSREDEIGDLATTLNFLSLNLSNALDNLKIKNSKLKEDIENERRLEKLRKDFIAGVSHELKTPIGIISGYAEGLKDGIADENSKDIYLDIIIDEADKMNKLVLDMLELSKLESGKMELTLNNFSLYELISDVTMKNLVDIRHKDLEIIKEIPEKDDFIVVGDEFKIEQVLTNFLTNAIKYTPKNEKIIIALHRHNDLIYCSIENTGVTFSESELSKIWNQFYRGDKSRNRNSKSTGLGLSIVKNILQLHDSSFGALNTNKGVKFYFTLKATNISSS